MKSFTSHIAKGLVALAIVGLGIAGFGSIASAQQVVYVPGQPLPSFQQPVFNTFTNVPFGIGNEADFVRVRPSTGDVSDNGSTGQRNSLYVDSLDAACNVGDKFDVRTYIHNGADPDFNNNGNGTAVAHGTTVAMSVDKFNETRKNYTFSSTISANNAASVSDSGRLNCASNVRLRLVPSSVKVYSKALGWRSISDSAVNGSTMVGTHGVGSGDVWGCWDERVMVAYVVEVVEVPQTPVYTCDLLSVSKLADRKYKFDVTYTAKNGATLKDITFDYGDGNTGSDNTHTYAKEGTFTVVAKVTFTVNGAVKTAPDNQACSKPLTVTKENCTVPGKENYPKDAPECKVCDVNPNLPYDSPDCVHELPNTGPGSIAAIFAAVTAAGALAHRYVTARRFNV